MATNEMLLSVKNLTVEYTSEGEVIHAVNNVSFNLEKARPSPWSERPAPEKPPSRGRSCASCRSLRPVCRTGKSSSKAKT